MGKADWGGIRLTADGDQAVRVEFDSRGSVDPAINRCVHAFCRVLDDLRIAGVTEIVPAFSTAAVYYDPLTISYDDLADRLRALCDMPVEEEAGVRIIDIPVVYGGKFGPDLAHVAESNGLTIDEAVELHAETLYRCYMIGFMPGFPYLGEVPPKLRTPRLSTPRTRVPAGPSPSPTRRRESIPPRRRAVGTSSDVRRYASSTPTPIHRR